MKKIIIIVFISLAQICHAQKQTIKVQAGSYSVYSTAYHLLTGDFINYNIGMGYTKENKKGTANFGLSLTFDQSFDRPTSGRWRKSLFTTTVAGEIEINYLKKGNLRAYGQLGFGFTSTNGNFYYLTGGKASEFDIIPNGNIALFCIQYGTNEGLIIEPSFGYKGFINVGYFKRF